jgi:hypothetical protein
MSAQRPCFAAIGALALCLATIVPAAAQPGPGGASPAALSDEAELERAIGLWDAGKFPECIKEFRALLGDGDRKLEQPDVIEQARVYRGV